MKKHLSAPGLLQVIRQRFSVIPDENSAQKKRDRIKLVDCLMSGLAVFSLKFPSLIKFDEEKISEEVGYNLKSLYKIGQIPSDTYMRERLDVVNPKELRKTFKAVFTEVQRGKYLNYFEYMDGYYLLSLDGTGYFSSSTIHCKNCCVKNHRDGTKTYYHQLLVGALVNPDSKVVLPFAPEPIQQQDGSSKNDCERNASKRFISDFRREHPHLKVIVVEDGLSSNAPHIRELEKHDMSYILVANESDHKNLFEEFRALPSKEYEMKRGNTIHQFRFTNGLSLNDANLDCLVNVLEYTELSSKGKKLHFAWVTDIELSEKNVYQIMRGGRSRWRIENETFNTLKNQGYEFEHNFGHGRKNLSTIFAYLMLLAFLVDQIQELCCSYFQKALKKIKRKKYLWERMRNNFSGFLFDSWEDFFGIIIDRHKGKFVFDSS